MRGRRVLPGLVVVAMALLAAWLIREGVQGLYVGTAVLVVLTVPVAVAALGDLRERSRRSPIAGMAAKAMKATRTIRRAPPGE